MSHAITYSCGHERQCPCNLDLTGDHDRKSAYLCPTCASADTTPPEPQRDDLLAQQHAMIRELADALKDCFPLHDSDCDCGCECSAQEVWAKRVIALRRVDAQEPPEAWAKMMRIVAWWDEYKDAEDLPMDLRNLLAALKEAT